jgi:hypothetical protein
MITAPDPLAGIQVVTHFPEPAPVSTTGGSLFENVASTAEPFPVSTGVPQLSAIVTWMLTACPITAEKPDCGETACTSSPVGAHPAGTGGVTVNGTELDAAAPGLTTVIVPVPAAAMRLAGTAAVTCVVLTNAVVSAVELHRTTDPLTKLLPLIVSVNAGPPAAVEAGAIDEIAAALLGGGNGVEGVRTRTRALPLSPK